MIWFAAPLDRLLSKFSPLPDEVDWLLDESFEFPGDTTSSPGGAPLHVTGMVPGYPDPAPAGTSPGWCRRLPKFLRPRG